MRHFLAVAVLGASLAFGGSVALAESNSAINGEQIHPQAYETQMPGQTGQFAPAGPATPQPTWLQYRLENIGQ